MNNQTREIRFSLYGLAIGFTSQIYRFGAIDKYGGIENILLLIIISMVIGGLAGYFVGMVSKKTDDKKETQINVKPKSEINWTLIISILLISIAALMGIAQINSTLEEQNLEKELEIMELQAKAELARQEKEKDLARTRLINAEKERQEREELQRKVRVAAAEIEKREKAEANKIEDWLSLECSMQKFNQIYDHYDTPNTLRLILRKRNNGLKPTSIEYLDVTGYLPKTYAMIFKKFIHNDFGILSNQSIKLEDNYLSFSMEFKGWYSKIGSSRDDVVAEIVLNIKTLNFTLNSYAGRGFGSGKCKEVKPSLIRAYVK